MQAAEANKHHSRVKPLLEFNQRKFLICLASGGGKMGGHAIITVEGVREDGTLYKRICDITACAGEESSVIQESLGNHQGYIDRIRVFEEFKEGFDYSTLKADTWYASAVKVDVLIANIQQKKEQIEKARAEGRNSPFIYQTAGSRRMWGLGTNKGDNCLTWAQKELIEASIMNEADAPKKIDLVKAPPNLHITNTHHGES